MPDTSDQRRKRWRLRHTPPKCRFRRARPCRYAVKRISKVRLKEPNQLQHGMVKVRSWRGHGCPPEASLTAFEGLGRPSALVRRGPASHTLREAVALLPEAAHKSTTSLRLTMQAAHGARARAADAARARVARQPRPRPVRAAADQHGRRGRDAARDAGGAGRRALPPAAGLRQDERARMVKVAVWARP